MTVIARKRAHLDYTVGAEVLQDFVQHRVDHLHVRFQDGKGNRRGINVIRKSLRFLT